MLGNQAEAANPNGSLGRPTTHLMSWNNYDGKHASSMRGESNIEEAVTANMSTSKSPPNVRGADSDKHQVSPDLSSSPLDRSFIVSPMGSVDLGRSGGR